MNINVTFKQKEKNLFDYANEHSSPAAYIKDLIMDDYKKKQSGYQQSSFSSVEPNFDFIE